MTPDLVVFDCDGVLVDTEHATAAVIAENFTQYGLPLSGDEVADLFTGGTMDTVMDEGKRRGADLPDGWLDEIYSLIYARLAQGVDVFDGVFQLLDALVEAGVPHYIASNGTMQKMRLSLGPSGLWDRFDGRIMCREDYLPKPDPAMILHAIARTNADPRKTVMIDDSTAGCSAGIAAGVHTIGFATEGQDADLAALGAEVANSMSQVQQLILN
ncbi:HAD family phosphatase [Octadecabacter sp. 1_MG-2023]|uniref:HAD family hydrolase n=1 Tax=unclassified Octadecabacter TaxID=196158 RepID=UPI001C0A3E93|nr:MULTISPECIES: HAD family phosphatase [unclassified Octadecabacter]MBU2992536.1 HAD family phosphatase [Octadecabacter sp. B2R22]MDO6734707.1 HAD family phosphatase [Octadecabacter sp. 1_MG-2023]